MFTATIFPQQHEQKSDSSSQQKIPFEDYLLNHQLLNENSFRISPESLLSFNNRARVNKSSPLWLEREYAPKKLNDKIDPGNKLPTILTLPLTLKYQREKKFCLVFGILEKIKDIFAFYLAYKHIHKYGLFHQP